LKKPQQVTQPQAFPQIESFIERVLEHDKLHQVLKNIKNSLTYGAIPHSTLPAYFKRKLQEKAQKHKQASSENGSIVNYLLSNLPPSLEDTKSARDSLERKIKQQIHDEFFERKTAREDRWKKEREDKVARAELDDDTAKTGGRVRKSKKDKKENFKLVKQMGDDGFETLVRLDENGNVIIGMEMLTGKKNEKTVEEKVKKQQKVVKSEVNSPTKNTFSGALVVGDIGDEIKEAKPKQQQSQADQKGKKNTQKPAQTKEKKSEVAQEPKAKTATKVEQPKTPTKKSEQPQQTETKKPKQKSEVAQEPKAKTPANKKTDKKNEGKKTKKAKSEEDEASLKTKSTTAASTQNNMVTPAVAIALLVFAVLALYTVFLS